MISSHLAHHSLSSDPASAAQKISKSLTARQPEDFLPEEASAAFQGDAPPIANGASTSMNGSQRPDLDSSEVTGPVSSELTQSDPLAPQSSLFRPVASEDPAVLFPSSDVRDEVGPVSKEDSDNIEEQKELQTNPINGGSFITGNSDTAEKELVDVRPITEPTSSDVAMPDVPAASSLPDDTNQPHVVHGDAPDIAPTPQVSQLSQLTNGPMQAEAMQDCPPSPGKVSRTREDEDSGDGPAAKRSRIDNEGSSVPEFKIPEVPQAASQEGSSQTKSAQEPYQPDLSQPITKPQHKFILKGIQNVRRTKDATSFNQPVDFVTLNIPTYPDIVKKPMDLRTMEEKLKAGQYTSIDTYVDDFNQIVENSLLFNGPEHPVTKSAQSIKATFDKQLNNLPGPNVVEPTQAEKKSKKALGMPVAKVNPPRRESRSSLGGNARSPTAGSPQQTFALGPQGVPLIRRDSTAGDGRPKREIHPPPPKDLPYTNQKPKKKKFQWELRFSQEVMNELNKPKYSGIGWPFYTPVDPVALNIPHYHKVIKRPMDLGTIDNKLKQGEYENAREFEADVRLVFANCYRFNPPSDIVHGLGKQFEAVFNDKWSQKKNWIDNHVPASGPQSPGSSPEPEEEEEEDEEEEEEENQLTILQKQIAAMSKQVEMIQKGKASPPAPNKKSTKSSKPLKKEPKKGNAATNSAKTDKKAASKPAKKEKIPYVTYEQKQDISNRINSLPESRMATALTIIRDNMPNLKVSVTSLPMHNRTRTNIPSQGGPRR